MNQPYAVKLELTMVGGSSVEREYLYYTLKELVNITGLPCACWFGRESNYDTLVIDLLGPSLHQLLQQHKKLCASTVACLANQLVLLKQYPNYVVELLLQLTCCVEGTSYRKVVVCTGSSL